jgi:hypothetical protein
MSSRFKELVGEVVSTCGLIEFATNALIDQLGKDRLLGNEIMRLSFDRRIRVLRDLVLDRTNLTADDIEPLCKQLSRIASERNMVAHNPIGTVGQEATELIIVVRDFSFVPAPKQLNETDVKEILERAQRSFVDLMEITIKIRKLSAEKKP